MTKDDMVRFTFRMPASMFNKLKTEASRMGVSVNSLILQTLWDWAKKNEAQRGLTDELIAGEGGEEE